MARVYSRLQKPVLKSGRHIETELFIARISARRFSYPPALPGPKKKPAERAHDGCSKLTRHVAFLRGINVGGHKIIKMEDLGRAFTSFGFKNVRTYIASGNVLFESPETDHAALTRKIERELRKSFGYDVTVLLRTIAEVEAMIKRNPFKKTKLHAGLKLYVTFLSKEPARKSKLPFVSPKKDFEVLRVHDREVYSLSLALPNGRFGNPVTFVEREFGALSTTRNWTTVKNITAVK